MSPLPLAVLLCAAATLAGCSAGPSGPAAAVTEAEAGAAVQRLIDLSSERTSAAMRELCALQQCHGMSSVLPHAPAVAPERAQAPREVCSFALPATAEQAGARLVVLRGERGDGQSYVTHVLLERVDDAVVAHEPGFWLGIRYTDLQEGRAWSGQGEVPATRSRHAASALRACTDTADWLAEVSGGT